MLFTKTASHAYAEFSAHNLTCSWRTQSIGYVHSLRGCSEGCVCEEEHGAEEAAN